MSTPNGTLVWGQGGIYDAIDDRAAITVLSNFRHGVVKAGTLAPAAQGGLHVQLGPFAAVVDCNDGTMAVILSTGPIDLAIAGGGTSARTDVIWADINVAAGSWAVNVYTPGQIVGRQGIELGRLTVPAGANAASQFTFAPAPAGFSPSWPFGDRAWTTTVNVPVNGVNNASVSVTFPAGLFTAAPNVFSDPVHGITVPWVSAATYPTATSCNVGVRSLSGLPGGTDPMPVHLLAVRV